MVSNTDDGLLEEWTVMDTGCQQSYNTQGWTRIDGLDMDNFDTDSAIQACADSAAHVKSSNFQLNRKNGRSVYQCWIAPDGADTTAYYNADIAEAYGYNGVISSYNPNGDIVGDYEEPGQASQHDASEYDKKMKN